MKDLKGMGWPFWSMVAIAYLMAGTAIWANYKEIIDSSTMFTWTQIAVFWIFFAFILTKMKKRGDFK